MTELAQHQVYHPYLQYGWKESGGKWKVNILVLSKGLICLL